jgi:hypothetical protein
MPWSDLGQRAAIQSYDRNVTSQASPSVLVTEYTTSESLLACRPPTLSTDAPTASFGRAIRSS